ncbi:MULTISPECIES: RcpC/CpaB family pilus assembly protein [Streptomyces]|uniref:RcpC/CpaB family pilus assembly protein n=2 Tax=Streptomyces TaxID=1883 RepID=A0ABU2XJ53_9ACTN|nr:RcpC/CpaB family pilus assembly protein [Streptomyces sp. DSM 41529]MDT0545962.1 RcpC/CpaB family pilus assembly protein [Streptomyces sp. DSM 41529]
MAAGLAMTAAALAAAAPSGGGDPRPAASSPPENVRREPRPAVVSAPVRIADAAAVRLLRPGDRVDVLAAPGAGQTRGPATARVIARGAEVTDVPRPRPVRAAAGTGAGDLDPGDFDTGDSQAAGGGALVVLAVPRTTAAALAGAATTSRLAVALCRS